MSGQHICLSLANTPSNIDLQQTEWLSQKPLSFPPFLPLCQRQQGANKATYATADAYGAWHLFAIYESTTGWWLLSMGKYEHRQFIVFVVAIYLAFWLCWKRFHFMARTYCPTATFFWMSLLQRFCSRSTLVDVLMRLYSPIASDWWRFLWGLCDVWYVFYVCPCGLGGCSAGCSERNFLPNQKAVFPITASLWPALGTT